MRRPYKRRKNPEKNIALVRFLGDQDINKFTKMLMISGKLQLAESIVASALFSVVDKRNSKVSGLDRTKEAISLFAEVIEKGCPSSEVRTKRVGGANYQVPVEISASRKKAILFRWILGASRKMVGTMKENLAKVLLEILDGRGEVIRKRDELHKMAAANRVFQSLGSRN
jgi:small subunit ribosomal protein S7